MDLLVQCTFFPLIKLFYRSETKGISMEDLRKCAPDSLGNNALQFLEKNGLVLFKGYEAHDLKHVLLGFETDLEGEICMQYFELGCGNRSFPVLTVVLTGILIMPENWRKYRRSYKNALLCNAYLHFKPEEHIHENLQELRKQLSIKIPIQYEKLQ